MHFIAEEAGAADVGAEGFAGEPVVGAPDDFGFDVVGEGIDEEFFADGHLGLVFRADEDFHAGLTGDSNDGFTKGGVVVLFHGLVAGVFDGVDGGFFFGDDPVGGVAEAGDAAEELAFREVMLGEEGGGGGVIAEVGGEGAIRAEGHEGAGAAAFSGQGEGVGVAEEGKFGSAENLDGFGDRCHRSGLSGAGTLNRERDAIDAVGFASFGVPAFDVFLGDEGGA